MKNCLKTLIVLVFSVIAYGSQAQRYKTASDTPRLNEEWVKVNNDLVTLQEKLTSEQRDLDAYKMAAINTSAEAQRQTVESRNQASKATNGNMKDLKRAESKSDDALDKAEDAESANKKVNKQMKKVAELNKDIQKKQERLNKIEQMRTAIRMLPSS